MRKVITALLAFQIPAAARGQEPAIPSRTILSAGPVNYWGSKKDPTEAPAKKSEASVWIEPIRMPDGRYAAYVPAPQVHEFLENPTPETARGYLAWQRERVSKLRRAMEVLEAMAAVEAKAQEKPKGDRPEQNPGGHALEILYFKQANCRYCGLQDRILAQLGKEHPELVIREIPKGQSPHLWANYGVTMTPTLVLASRRTPKAVLRGLASKDQILAALRKPRPDEK